MDHEHFLPCDHRITGIWVQQGAGGECAVDACTVCVAMAGKALRHIDVFVLHMLNDVTCVLHRVCCLLANLPSVAVKKIQASGRFGQPPALKGTPPCPRFALRLEANLFPKSSRFFLPNCISMQLIASLSYLFISIRIWICICIYIYYRHRLYKYKHIV